MPRRCAALLLLALLPGASCDPGSMDRSGSGAVRDSAGITIVENAAPAWSDDAAWTLSAEPTLAMGAPEGDPDHEFYQIAGATRLSDGTIVVANAGTQQLRFYAADGTLLRSVGRKGSGPGEFQMLMMMIGTPGDSLLTFDGMNRRMSVFGPDGGHVRDFGGTEATNPILMLVQGRLNDGSYVAQVANRQFGPAMFERKAGPTRDSVYILRLDSAGTPVDTLGLFPGPRSDVQMIEFGGRTVPMPIMIPFSPTAHVATAAGQVYVGVSDSYEIGAYTPSGELTALIRRPYQPRPVTEVEIEDTRARLTEMIEDQSNPFAAQIGEAYRNVTYPETMPAFGEMIVDRAGYLWVADPVGIPDEPRIWSVFDRDGVWLGRVSTPPRFNVREIGMDYLLGHATDDLEVERVLLYALAKPVPPAR